MKHALMRKIRNRLTVEILFFLGSAASCGYVMHMALLTSDAGYLIATMLWALSGAVSSDDLGLLTRMRKSIQQMKDTP